MAEKAPIDDVEGWVGERKASFIIIDNHLKQIYIRLNLYTTEN